MCVPRQFRQRARAVGPVPVERRANICDQAADLPIARRRVVLRVTVRRFWCDAVLGRRIFAERFGANILAPLSRRTGRLETIVHHLGLALGGRPAAAFADRLMMPVSNDTLLRVVRRAD